MNHVTDHIVAPEGVTVTHELVSFADFVRSAGQSDHEILRDINEVRRRHIALMESTVTDETLDAARRRQISDDSLRALVRMDELAFELGL